MTPTTLVAAIEGRQLAPFKELPQVCRQVIANVEFYDAELNWRGCVACSRSVGVSVAEARAYYEATHDPAYRSAVRSYRDARP